MDINKSDTVLTLTSGGCNALNLLVHGAGKVVAVDCNPAQSSLLELKAAAIRCGRRAAPSWSWSAGMQRESELAHLSRVPSSVHSPGSQDTVSDKLHKQT